MNIEELKRLAEAATPGPWAAAISSNMVNGVCATFETICETGKNIDDALYIAAANPAAVLELIAEIERVTKQRDELLEALKDAREMVSDWAGYASPYFQEKHDIDGDLKKLDDAIARMEG